MEKNIDNLCINAIRFLSADGVQKANSGHPGMPMGCAPIAYILYTKFMKHNPVNPKWINRDRFVLSAGHSEGIYVVNFPASMDLFGAWHVTKIAFPFFLSFFLYRAALWHTSALLALPPPKARVSRGANRAHVRRHPQGIRAHQNPERMDCVCHGMEESWAKVRPGLSFLNLSGSQT